MTLEGTNTWVLRAPRSDEIVVVDPGPDDDEHIARVAELGTISLVLISHKHEDHTGGIDKIVERTGAVVRSVGSGFLRGLGGPLTDGEVIDAAGLRITVMATPGHTADSLSFVLDDGDGPGAVLTADTVLGRGTTVIDTEDGSCVTTSIRCTGSRGSVSGLCCPATGPSSGICRASRRCTWRTGRNGSSRCVRRYANSATMPPRARSSNTSTPTSTRNCGTPRRRAFRLSSTTCGTDVLSPKPHSSRG